MTDRHTDRPRWVWVWADSFTGKEEGHVEDTKLCYKYRTCVNLLEPRPHINIKKTNSAHDEREREREREKERRERDRERDAREWRDVNIYVDAKYATTTFSLLLTRLDEITP